MLVILLEMQYFLKCNAEEKTRRRKSGKGQHEFLFLHPLPTAVNEHTVQIINLQVQIYRKTKPASSVKGWKRRAIGISSFYLVKWLSGQLWSTSGGGRWCSREGRLSKTWLRKRKRENSAGLKKWKRRKKEGLRKTNTSHCGAEMLL